MSTERSTETTNEVETDQRTKIRVENIEKQFGRVIAVEDVNLEVYENEIFALVGDNGAGKSTLMNVLSGVYQPTEGQIYVDGERATFGDPGDARAAGIETVYQDLALMNDLDVATNIFVGEFPTRGVGPLRIIDWDETYERTEQIMRETLDRDIDPHTEVEFLSGGQRQLVAVGRALAFDPDVIILDEPSSALSVDATRLVYETIQRLKDEGHTIIIVSHNLDTVMEYADRIAVLYQGQVVNVTPVAETDADTLTNLMVTGKATRED